MNTLPAPLPEGWFLSDPNQAEFLRVELRKELPPGHVLFGVSVQVVAHRLGTDDILCRHLEHPAQFTVVHLSWLGREEINPRHPHVECDGDFDAFLRYEAAFLGR
jgi:hypothetical protein